MSKFVLILLYQLICVVFCVFGESSRQCITPNGESAQCVSFLQCPIIGEIITSQDSTGLEFVRQSLCDITLGNKESLVCCGSENRFSKTPRNETQNSNAVKNANPTANDLLPSKRICGYQARDDRFESRNFTVLDEFPWLALLKYTIDNDTQLACLGTIITRRYILSAAHCLKHKYANLTHVRLGEYNPYKDEDCLENPDYAECNEPVVDIAIEELIPHPHYNLRDKSNDIGLIRLREPIRFTDFIRPICLPTEDVTLATPGELLISSGWNSFDYNNRTFFNRKKRAENKLVTLAECKSYYERILKRITITENQICTRETSDESSCQGDSGGPVMFFNKIQWHIEGVVSFSFGCIPGTIGVHSKVSAYLDWIINNIRP